MRPFQLIHAGSGTGHNHKPMSPALGGVYAQLAMLPNQLFFRPAGLLCTLALCLSLAPARAATILFTGPQDANGNTCDATLSQQNHCIIGDRLEFQMFDVALSQPNTPGGGWKLVLNTNYPVALPGGTEVIPSARYGNAMLAMCDFMIEWNNKYYGIVLHAHDGYTAGSLYEVSGFQNSGDVMSAQGETSPRPRLPALINASGTLLGAGTLSAAANAGANGVTQALYKVTVDFVAPASFLATGDFRIHACSFACDNGYVTGVGNFVKVVPEPSTWGLVLLGVGVIVWKRRLER
jgi:PEP-CTERM motif